MRTISLVVSALLVSAVTMAQSFVVTHQQISEAYNLDQIGEITFAGNAFHVGSFSYGLDNAYQMAYDEAMVKDNTVRVTYDGATASVVIAGNIADQVSATVNGAHVTLLQASSVTDEITYTLSGCSDNGSLFMDGNLKATFILDNLTLHNPDSAAINIQDGKRICVVLDGATHLSDGIKEVNDGTDAHNACFYINGHTEFEGDGTLAITGNVKHAFTSDEYTKLKSSMTGTINVVSAVGDAFHIGQYFMLNGGNILLSSTGDGIDVGKKKDATAENNGQFIVSGGTIGVRVSGASSDALKCEDAFTMSGGSIDVLALGAGGRVLSSDGQVTISAGKFRGASCGGVNANDEDRKAQGIKSDSNITITGGEVYVAASKDKGTAFKTDYTFAINGGTVMGIGGKSVSASNTSTQSSTKFSGQNIVGGQTATYNGVSFAIPAEYSNSAAYVIVSKP